MGSSDRGSRSFFGTDRCRGSAFITFSFGTITVRVLTLGVVSLRAIATTLWLVPMISSNAANYLVVIIYSHSMVPGGLEVISYTTRLIPRTSFIIRLAVLPKNFISKGKKSAVIPSVEVTARSAQT